MTTAQVEESIRVVVDGISYSWSAWMPYLRSNSASRSRSGGSDSAALIAASVRREACEDVIGWVRLVMDEHDPDVMIAAYDMPAMCEYLTRNATWLSGHEAVDVMLTELGDVAYRLDGILPRGRSTKILVGHCPSCQTEVHGDTDREVVKCRHCDRKGSWAQWEAWVLGRRELMTSPGLAEFIHQSVGITVAVRTVTRWIAAGMIVPSGSAKAAIGVSGGTPLYDPWAAVLVALHRERRVAA